MQTTTLLLFFSLIAYQKCTSFNERKLTFSQRHNKKIFEWKLSEPYQKNYTVYQNNREEPNICPEGFQRIPGKLTCYFRTKPGPFPRECPYPNFLSGDTEDHRDIDYSGTWVMAYRNTTDGFDPFEWTYHTYLYGYYFAPTYMKQNDVLNKNCLIHNSAEYLTPVSCNENHSAICVYPYDSMKKYCEMYESLLKFDACGPSTYDIENRECYCVSNDITMSPQKKNSQTRNFYCDLLAEPRQEYQNVMLMINLDMIRVFQRCWFGLYKDKNKALRWATDGSNTNYTSPVGKNNVGTFGAINIQKKEWDLIEDDGTIDCGICDIKILQNKRVSLKLQYVSELNELQLQIINLLQLSDRYGHRALYCFAGPTNSSFKTRLQLRAFVQHTDDEEIIIVKFQREWKFPIYYWCEGFQTPNFTPVYSNKILLYDKQSDREYAIHALIKIEPDTDPYLEWIPSEATQNIKNKLIIPDVNGTLRATKILNLENSTMAMVFHFTTTTTNNEEEEYQFIQELLQTAFNNDELIDNITRFDRCDVCMPTTSKSNDTLLRWPKTAIGDMAMPKNFCFKENGGVVKRKCEGDFLYGAIWSEDIGTCYRYEYIPERTQELYDLLTNENITANELSENLTYITENNTEVTTTEIYLISELLEKLESFGDEVNGSDVVTIISNVMAFDTEELEKSQNELNSTDKMLNSLDNILTNIEVYEDQDYSVISSSRLLVQMSDIHSTNIVGLLLTINPDGTDFENSTLAAIYRNASITDNLNNTELVTYLPEDLIQELESCTNSTASLKLVLGVFYNDVLFNENTQDSYRQANSKILSVLFPNLSCSFKTRIPVVFYPLNQTDVNQNCSFWNYGLDKVTQANKMGYWSEDGVMVVNSTNTSHIICQFDHTTHFALLMSGSLTKEISDAADAALEIITAIGIVFTLTCIFLIFLMALISQNIRNSSSSKIMLHFSFSVALQIILLYLSDNAKSNRFGCTIVGIGLHYTLLSVFCWMLVIAFFQYRRFVIVFQKPISHAVAKCCVFCWCLPLIPVTILIAISNERYTKNAYGLCYPSNLYFYFGVFLPISAIFLTNLIIFIKILLSVCNNPVKAHGENNKDKMPQFILAAFLFFLLGISWIFGIAVSLGAGIVFSYLFCLTSSFQGLAMFLFFLEINDNYRKLANCLKHFCVVVNYKYRIHSSSTKSVDRKSIL